MAKPGEVIYDFSTLDNNEDFQEFLNLSLENHAEDISIEECKEGIKLFAQNTFRR